ncbi:MAG: hypothetical protein NVS2B3_11270 [Vulcanimicrobiaceae bacterium]
MPVRNDDPATDSGTLHAAGASLHWAVAGSTLVCRAFEGDPAAFASLANAANALAVERFVALLVARVSPDDSHLAALRAAGFADDGEAIDGECTLVRYVR